MALDYTPKGWEASPKNVGATKVATWPIKNIKVPVENNGGAAEFSKSKK